MPRLFVALRPPPDVAAALAALRGDVPGARWTAGADLHLTLAFLGEVASITPVEAALSALSGPPVNVTLEVRAAYPGADRARVLVAEGPPEAGLSALHRAVAAACAPFRRPEARPFRPHVTLARLRDADAAAVRAWLSGPPPRAAFRADEVVLVESRPTPTGSRYATRAVYRPGSP